jgi:hypothetical protein
MQSPSLKLASAAIAVLAIGLLSGTLPADAQLVHRNNDGTVFINPLLCLSDYQVRQAIAAQGFTSIYLNAPIENHIRARATKGKTVYMIDFNRCGGGIVGVAPLRRAN